MPPSDLLDRVRRAGSAGAAISHARPPRWRRDPAVHEAGAENRWRSRPLLTFAVKALVVLVPAGAAIAVTALLNRDVATPGSLLGKLGWWALLLGVSTAVALLVERQTRRLLPLAMLFKLTLLFPDEAPSRYRVARAAGNPQRLRQLASGSSPRSRAAAHVLAWVAQLSKHDRHTRGHSERVRVFSDLIAEQMQISGLDRDKLRWAALLHDIGKLQVPTTVLNKPGKPSATEWDVLRQHPATGLALVGPLAAWLGPWAGGISDHHERYDGTGYPRGLAGEQISPAGRIVAVADAYETMTTNRSYKRAVAAATAREELARCAGSHFDPSVVRAFLAVGLPRILYGIGPISFLVHLPFLARVPDAGLGLLAVAGQAAAPVAAGLTAASVATVAVVSPTPPSTRVADSATGQHSWAPAAKATSVGLVGSAATLARLTGTTPAHARSTAGGSASTTSSSRVPKPSAATPAVPEAEGSQPADSSGGTGNSAASNPRAAAPATKAPTPSGNSSNGKSNGNSGGNANGNAGGKAKGNSSNGNANGDSNGKSSKGTSDGRSKGSSSGNAYGHPTTGKSTGNSSGNSPSGKSPSSQTPTSGSTAATPAPTKTKAPKPPKH